MKPLLCNFGVMILLLGPFIIIPAMVMASDFFSLETKKSPFGSVVLRPPSL